jgi:hypothetical protein
MTTCGSDQSQRVEGIVVSEVFHRIGTLKLNVRINDEVGCTYKTDFEGRARCPLRSRKTRLGIKSNKKHTNKQKPEEKKQHQM